VCVCVCVRTCAFACFANTRSMESVYFQVWFNTTAGEHVPSSEGTFCGAAYDTQKHR